MSGSRRGAGRPRRLRRLPRAHRGGRPGAPPDRGEAQHRRDELPSARHGADARRRGGAGPGDEAAPARARRGGDHLLRRHRAESVPREGRDRAAQARWAGRHHGGRPPRLPPRSAAHRLSGHQPPDAGAPERAGHPHDGGDVRRLPIRADARLRERRGRAMVVPAARRRPEAGEERPGHVLPQPRPAARAPHGGGMPRRPHPPDLQGGDAPAGGRPLDGRRRVRGERDREKLGRPGPALAHPGLTRPSSTP